jgi:hypothetical protein
VQILARPFGITAETIKKWAKPVSSDENPYAWGNGNPLDRTDKLIREAHVYDPEKAREIAEYFPALVDELDYAAGWVNAGSNGADNSCPAIQQVVECIAKLMNVSVGCFDDREKMTQALAITLELKTRANHLEGCLRGLLRTDEEANKY